MRILCFYPRNMFPVYFYRGPGVMDRLRKEDRTVEVFEPPAGWESNLQGLWKSMLGADVVYFMKCCENEHIVALDFALRMNVPVWYDIDDNLYEVPPDNPAHRTFKDPLVLKNVDMFLTEADLVTVTTASLLEYLSPKIATRNKCIVPNALDTYAFPDFMESVKCTDNLVTWRGGESHKMDLLAFEEYFLWFAEMAEKTRWELWFIGHEPTWLTYKYKCFRYVPTIPEFYSYLRAFRRTIHPRAHIVPLVNNKFNQSKSCISAIEAIYAGALPIVPDCNIDGFGEWNISGAHQYHDIDTLKAATEYAMHRRNDAWRMGRMESHRNWVHNWRTLPFANSLRLEYLRSIL